MPLKWKISSDISKILRKEACFSVGSTSWKHLIKLKLSLAKKMYPSIPFNSKHVIKRKPVERLLIDKFIAIQIFRSLESYDSKSSVKDVEYLRQVIQSDISQEKSWFFAIQFPGPATFGIDLCAIAGFNTLYTPHHIFGYNSDQSVLDNDVYTDTAVFQVKNELTKEAAKNMYIYHFRLFRAGRLSYKENLQSLALIPIFILWNRNFYKLFENISTQNKALTDYIDDLK